MLYPLRFMPYFKEFIWGGRKLQTLFNKDLPPNLLIGESWEVYSGSVVRDGDLSGYTMPELIMKYGKDFLGTRLINYKNIPLIIKLSTTEMDLSIQVHPDDEMARKLEPHSEYTGKAEAIYILKAEESSKIYHGFNKQIQKEDLLSILNSGQMITSCLNNPDVEKDDVVFVPPGVVHGYGSGLIYFEVQQNSDITYRLYDWNRVDANNSPRELHIDKALNVIDYDAVMPSIIRPLCIEEEYGSHCFLTACRHFLVERFDISKTFVANNTGESFHVLCMINGSAILRLRYDVQTEYELNLGDVILLPASIAEYMLEPYTKCQVLRTYVPDLKKDVVDYFIEKRISPDSVLHLGGSLGKGNDLASLIRLGYK